jgi:hypothetical protein
MDLDLGTQFSQVLDKVVSKRIVVIENEDHDEVSVPPAEGQPLAIRSHGGS